MVERTKRRLALFGILLVAVVLRFYGIEFGLPQTECRPDETSLVYKALGFFSGDLNPHFFNYPSLYMYALFVLYGVYFLIEYLLGALTSDMLTEVIVNPDRFILISRVLSAFLGSASVWVVYQISSRMFCDRTALLSAFFTSICYLHVRDSHFGTTDVAMTFFVLCGVYFIIEMFRKGSTLDYLLGGSFAGLATSTKYGGVLLIVPGVMAHIFHQFKMSATGGTKFSVLLKAVRSKSIWLFGLSSALLFLIFTPYSILDPSQFLADFRSEVHHLSRGHTDITLERGWWYHIRYTLPYGTGWAMFLTSLAGIVVFSRNERRQRLILFSFPLVLYIFAGRGHTVFVRYMVPVVPFLCIASALFLIRISNRIPSLLPVLALVIAAQSIYNSVSFDQLLARKDNRLLAAGWINQHVEPGSSLYHSSSWGQAQVAPSLETLEQSYVESRSRGRQGRLLEATIAHYRSSNFLDGYQVRNQIDWDSPGDYPDYVMLYRSPLKAYNKISDRLQQAVSKEYELSIKLEAIPDLEGAHWYDQQDAFYVPYYGFHGIRRPGPNIYIYRKIS